MFAHLHLVLPHLLLSSTAFAQDDASAPVTVSGVVFSHFGVELSNEAATDFDVDRVYLNFRKKIGDDFGVRVTTDVGRIDDEDGKLRLYLKYAYAEWRDVLPGATLRFGAAGMPFPGYYDAFWGHRYVAKAFTDANKLLNTSDFGLHALGTIGDGHADWQLSIVNGEGYGAAEADTDKAIVGRATFDALSSSESGSLPITLTASQDLMADAPRTLYGGALAFANDRTKVWVEYIGTAQADDTGSGYSASVVQGLGPVSLVARYDFLDDDTNADDDSTTSLIGGVSAEIENGIGIALTFEQSADEADADNPEQSVFLHTQAKF